MAKMGEEEEKYEVLQKIGQGSFGIIRKVRRKADGTVLCRKEISYSKMSEKEKHQLAAELDILRGLRHPNVVQYYTREHIKSTSDIHLYMEYCGNGDLGGYIKALRDEGRYASEDFVWEVFAQLVSALYRCHYGEDAPKVGEEAVVKKGRLVSKQGHNVILHRDLKPENVFLGNNNAVKLGDFGLSKMIRSHDFASTYVGTPFYMSPEICAAERYSHFSDVWSLGCIIYELATRCVPFDARSHVELVMKIKSGRIKPLPDFYSRELWETISWCLKVDPAKRPDMAQLLNVKEIKAVRVRVETTLQLERATQDRDSTLHKLNVAHQQIRDLQQEVERLREAGKKIEMEWHAKATLAIDQRVAEYKTLLQAQFDFAVEERVEEKLRLHRASLPPSHGIDNTNLVASHVRSSTPPGKSQRPKSTETVPTVSAIEDLMSLSIAENEGDDGSPMPRRTKTVMESRRKPINRAQTLANYSFETEIGSPIDVAMTDPSPLPTHVAPMSIKGLSLSPRRNGETDRLSGAGLKKNLFAMANEQRLRPKMAGDSDYLTDAEVPDTEDELADSIIRPSSGISNPVIHGDPFKAADAEPQKSALPTKRVARPMYSRQRTMPVSLPAQQQRSRPNSGLGTRNYNKGIHSSPEKEKENRPPSSQAQGRPNVPIATAISPKRPVTGKDGVILTPSRKAPAPPAAPSGALPKAVRRGLTNITPGKGGVRGRTILELAQARSTHGGEEGRIDGGRTVGWGTPAKWDPMVMGDDMPSPFIKRAGRLVR
ncbi:kinase-like protein [Piedraia hortae CBS 480.64]|uniref:non-specific serine/threonine protein kinase n=1 Tax=Piedraia hortae CBS 480.64 TaxID=1314780 RepID=A0A6A7BYP5_9PEZI|nr:kinase-like protein [Piedraia hortae CBS 480.64]